MINKSIKNIINQIEKKLNNAFSPLYLVVLDESHKHNTLNIKSHIKIILVTEKFLFKNLVTRHKSVYKILAQELSNNIHALALHTYTIIEWQQHKKFINSPICYNKVTKN